MPKTITFSKIVRQRLELQYGKSSKFMSELFKVLKDNLDELDFMDEYELKSFLDSHCRIVPDYFRINGNDQIISIYEIEDSHPLTVEKLCRLRDIFWLLDYVYWEFKLFIVDRYGFEKLMPLFETVVSLDILMKDARAENTEENNG